MSAEYKLQEFLDQGAIGAYVGGKKVMELIGQGKEHLVYRYYEQICNYGDNEKVRGIVEIVYAMNREDLLENPTVCNLKTNAFLGIPVVCNHANQVELFINLKAGMYAVSVEMEVKNLKDYSNHFDVDVYDNAGNIIRYGAGYPYDERMIFEVSDLEEGICRVDVYVKGDKGTIRTVKIEPFVY